MAREDVKRIFVKNLRWFFRPVARFALRHGLTLQDLYEGLKQALVDESIQELEKIGGQTSGSRIALMSGVHRKDITRIVNASEGAVLKEGSLISRIIAKWKTDPEFQNDLGEPKVLSINGKDNDFEKLVISVSRELNPMTIAKELERLELVRPTKVGLKLVLSVYIPKGNVREALNLLSSDTADLWDAIQENVFDRPQIANLHIKTSYDAVPDSYVPKVRQWLLEEGSAFHERAQDFLSKCDKDLNPKISAEPGKNKVSLLSHSFLSTFESENGNKSEAGIEKERKKKRN